MRGDPRKAVWSESGSEQGQLLIGHCEALLLEQLEAQSLDSLTAPGEVLLMGISLELLIGHWAALLVVEQLDAQSLDSLTAPGAASLLQLLEQELELETAPRAAVSSVCLLLSQAARTLSRAAAARVVRVRVMA